MSLGHYAPQQKDKMLTHFEISGLLKFLTLAISQIICYHLNIVMSIGQKPNRV